MNISVIKTDIFLEKTDLTVFGVFSGNTGLTANVRAADRRMGGDLFLLAKDEEFLGKNGQILSCPSHGKLATKRVLLVGLGEKKKFDVETCRRTAGLIVKYAKKVNAKKIVIDQFPGLAPRDLATGLAEGALLGDYAFLNYHYEEKKTSMKKGESQLILSFNDNISIKATAKAVAAAKIACAATIYARDLVNEPASVVTPAHLVEQAMAIARKNKNVKVKIFDRLACEKMGMGAFLAAAKGSDEPPFFIHLVYRPEKTNGRKIALVGKGLTFDSGGLSLKPTRFMTMEKSDMAGAAVVLAVFSSLDQIKPSMEIHGLVAACENMISGRAMRPGDIVRTMNGKTVEIMNADAEGRLTLSDAISYAVKKIKPDFIIDLATLTGSCLVALGEQIAGLISNNQNFADRFLFASRAAGEQIWPLPLAEVYRDSIKNGHGELANVAPSRYGDALIAALFLEEFVGQTPWVHVDFGGPAYFEGDYLPYAGKGATGFAVRTLLNFLSK